MMDDISCGMSRMELSDNAQIHTTPWYDKYYWLIVVQIGDKTMSGQLQQPQKKYYLIATVKDNILRFMLSKELLETLHLLDNTQDSFDDIIAYNLKYECVSPFNRIDPKHIPDVFWIVSYKQLCQHLDTFNSDFCDFLQRCINDFAKQILTL